MIVGPDDAKNYRKIMNSLNKNDEIPLLPIDTEYLQEVHTRVNMVRDIETTEYRFQKSKRQNDWFTKSAEEIGIELDDNDKLGEQAHHRAYIKQMKAELNVLLRRPILPRTLAGKYPTKSGQLATLPETGPSPGVHQTDEQMKAELNFLLRRPILPRTLAGKYPTRSGQLATLPETGEERDAISSVKKDRKWQQKMMARSRNTPRPIKPTKQKKSKWKKKRKA